MSKYFEETIRLQSEKRQEWIRKIREERLQGNAEGTSSVPRLASSSAASFPGRNELQDDLQSLGFTPSLAKPEIGKEVGRRRARS